MKFSVFAFAICCQLFSSFAFSFFHQHSYLTRNGPFLFRASERNPGSFLDSYPCRFSSRSSKYCANFVAPGKVHGIDILRWAAKASDRDEDDEFWEIGDITEKLDSTIPPSARVPVHHPFIVTYQLFLMRICIPQRIQVSDTVLSRGISFGEILSDAIETAVLKAAQKIPPSNVPALAVIFFSSEYSEQGYSIFELNEE